MLSRSFTICGYGLRSRQVEHIVRVANKYPCRISIEYGPKRVNAKSMMGVFSLGVPAGESMLLVADGEREGEALDELANVISGEMDCE